MCEDPPMRRLLTWSCILVALTACEDLPEPARDEVVQRCVETIESRAPDVPGGRRGCECIVDELDERMNLPEMIAAFNDLRQDREIPREVRDAVETCAERFSRIG